VDDLGPKAASPEGLRHLEQNPIEVGPPGLKGRSRRSWRAYNAAAPPAASDTRRGIPPFTCVSRYGEGNTMGDQFRATCLDCRKKFTVSSGGGFSFHLVRCDKCGKTKDMGFDELGELHLRYLKGLPGPYSVATAGHDESVRLNAPVEPISEDEYHAGVDDLAGECRCGGKYSLDAPPRCPRCHSTRIEAGASEILDD